jgi:hypothetical protein
MFWQLPERPTYLPLYEWVAASYIINSITYLLYTLPECSGHFLPNARGGAKYFCQFELLLAKNLSQSPRNKMFSCRYLKRAGHPVYLLASNAKEGEKGILSENDLAKTAKIS